MNRIIFYDNFNFLNIKFTNYHYTDNRKGSPMNYLAYMIKGDSNIVSENKTIQVKEGDVFYIPKNLSYQSYWHGDSEINFLSFGFLELNTKENTNFELQTIPCDGKLIEKIIHIPTNGKRVDCKTLSLFYDAMSEIIPNLKYSSENKEEMMVAKIKHCIRNHPHSPLHEIASMCMVSEPYLYALFKKITQTTPNSYRQKVLCERGIELLLTTDKKIEEIAGMIQFSSSSYFRKVLKKHTGSTPREIRKNRLF
mgnify:FL=1